MNMDASYKTSKALLTLTQQYGYIISSTQLVRWHRAGLLPRPRQLPLKGTRGTCSLYPSGTSEQLLLLCELRTTERRLSHLAWQLWLMGYPVNLSLIRAQLTHATTRLARWRRWFVDFKQAIQAKDASGEALDLIEHYAAGNLHSQLLRRIRKRTGRQHFPTFLHLLVRLATEPGSETTRDDDEHEWLFDLRILALGLGLEKRFVQKKDPLEYYLIQALMPQLHWLFRRLQEVRWEQLLECVTDFDLLQARDELRTWLMRLSNARYYRDRLPDDYPSFDLDVADIFRSLPTTDQALALVSWVALRSLSPSWLSNLMFRVPAHSFSLQREAK
ncbi:MAG: hypothetical protein J2P37_14185 [Ktedonobacteraceae bacterium]|nr:hypothetical protein [Ktedonobacteraceae bacterium]MBO0789510.1 hypothetical protein [Ktedonobacteraceae bacterium]